MEMKPFNNEKIREFIRSRSTDKEQAEDLILGLTDDDYQLYGIPRDLEFAIEILNDGKIAMPRSRTELYKAVFNPIFDRWQKNGNSAAEGELYRQAYKMIKDGESVFDSVDSPRFEEVTNDLFERKFLIRREKHYIFRHDLIRSYLASEYFYPRWHNLFKELKGKNIDGNWQEMLKFACENLEDENEVKLFFYEILDRSIRKDVVRNLYEWLKNNYPERGTSWEISFYAKYGELDFR
jgi:hypothetical protein